MTLHLKQVLITTELQEILKERVRGTVLDRAIEHPDFRAVLMQQALRYHAVAGDILLDRDASGPNPLFLPDDAVNVDLRTLAGDVHGWTLPAGAAIGHRSFLDQAAASQGLGETVRLRPAVGVRLNQASSGWAIPALADVQFPESIARVLPLIFEDSLLYGAVDLSTSNQRAQETTLSALPVEVPSFPKTALPGMGMPNSIAWSERVLKATHGARVPVEEGKITLLQAKQPSTHLTVVRSSDDAVVASIPVPFGNVQVYGEVAALNREGYRSPFHLVIRSGSAYFAHLPLDRENLMQLSALAFIQGEKAHATTALSVLDEDE